MSEQVPQDEVMQCLKVTDLQFEHYRTPHRLGVEETRPRLSWKFRNFPKAFVQKGYEIEIYDKPPLVTTQPIHRATFETQQSVLVPWPLPEPLRSRQRLFARVKAWGEDKDNAEWSDFASIEAGLLERRLWKCQRITSPWDYESRNPQPEELFRKEFQTQQAKGIERARLYITAQGVYEAEINGKVIGDHFLAPGWTVYDKRLQYQTFDVTDHLSKSSEENCIGVRVAEGWFCGRLSLGGGVRNTWGDRPALLAQLEIVYSDGSMDTVITDSSWFVCKGPSILAEIYNGEKYDARLEIPDWSSDKSCSTGSWQIAKTFSPLSESTELVSGEAEPVRRITTIRPIEKIVTPLGKTVLDFGQNLVGYTRIKHVKGTKGQSITLSHAEVLENGELGGRPLRTADNIDRYTLKGAPDGETWEPRFTFHGYRYVQVDGWPGDDDDLLQALEAVVCHTEMKRVGEFSCSDPLVNKLHENVIWSMRGNFLSVPTDCPQRDERLGWTGDLALFAPTASLLFDCTSMLKGWLKDVFAEQTKHNGVPTFVVPDTLTGGPVIGKVKPCAIWADVTVLAPWSLYQATGDEDVLRCQYQSMVDWLSRIPKNKEELTHLWEEFHFQLGDWLDPVAPPDKPWAGRTDAVLVANAYLVHSLDFVAEIAKIIGKDDDAIMYSEEAKAARAEFAHEYISPSGRLMSDSQTAYSLAIVFDLFPSEKQRAKASQHLAWIVQRNAFKIGTGFAGTPFVCEALTLAGHPQMAYSMLLNKECPSWLYPVSMGSTTIWERWDSMMPDGSINPGNMTSFNHYALGAVAKFLWERLAGLQCAAPGWKKIRVAPVVGGDFTSASASIETPYGTASSSWVLEDGKDEMELKTFQLKVVVAPNTSAEVIFPGGAAKEPVTVDSGEWSFSVPFEIRKDWPIEVLSSFP